MIFLRGRVKVKREEGSSKDVEDLKDPNGEEVQENGVKEIIRGEREGEMFCHFSLFFLSYGFVTFVGEKLGPLNGWFCYDNQIYFIRFIVIYQFKYIK